MFAVPNSSKKSKLGTTKLSSLAPQSAPHFQFEPGHPGIVPLRESPPQLDSLVKHSNLDLLVSPSPWEIQQSTDQSTQTKKDARRTAYLSFANKDKQCASIFEQRAFASYTDTNSINDYIKENSRKERALTTGGRFRLDAPRRKFVEAMDQYFSKHEGIQDRLIAYKGISNFPDFLTRVGLKDTSNMIGQGWKDDAFISVSVDYDMAVEYVGKKNGALLKVILPPKSPAVAVDTMSEGIKPHDITDLDYNADDTLEAKIDEMEKAGTEEPFEDDYDKLELDPDCAKEQYEYLINRGSYFKILEIGQIQKKDNTLPFLTVELITNFSQKRR